MAPFFLLLLISALGATPVATAPPEAPAEKSVSSPLVDFAVSAQEAKETYFRGGHQAALALYDALWDRLQQGEIVEENVLVDAVMYRGEVQYQLKDRTGAWQTFAWLLRRDTDVVMSPITHPQDVVHWFELVRRRVRQEVARQPDPVEDEPPPPPPRPPVPMWGYLPLGIPQFTQKRIGAGVAWGGLQLALAGVSVGTWVYLNGVNQQDHPPQWADDDVTRQVNLRRYLIQWPATLGFYGAWLGSHLSARRLWHNQYEVTLAVQVGQSPGLRITGRF